MKDALQRLGISENDYGYVDSQGFCYEFLENAIWGGVFGFRFCGNVPKVLKAIKECLEAVESKEAKDENDFRFYVLFYVLDKPELTHHGFPIRGSWLSEKGKDVLTVLRYLEER